MPRRQEDQAEAVRIARRLGTRLRSLRKKNRWTQDELSERILLTAEAYARIERGNSLPSFPTLMRLCTALETRPDVLLIDASDGLRAMGFGDEPDGADGELHESMASVVFDLRQMPPQLVRDLVQLVRSMRNGAPVPATFPPVAG